MGGRSHRLTCSGLPRPSDVRRTSTDGGLLTEYGGSAQLAKSPFDLCTATITGVTTTAQPRSCEQAALQRVTDSEASHAGEEHLRGRFHGNKSIIYHLA